ncbi:translation initiation factor IF-2-like isoform X2 [Acinonyx jubatus]|uniref:Translation initiation factor IF-2-like isoform X2 n=1 Tax=Acinonyx jubatus TaxID=32536 RepID=A0ABM3PPT2_ACIJB|nr:translation initiation factor IF-2-like isoform X2 [Acinonyx jubatus]
MAGRRREHTKEAASAGNKKLAGASPERPLPPCPPPRVTLGASAPTPASVSPAALQLNAGTAARRGGGGPQRGVRTSVACAAPGSRSHADSWAGSRARGRPGRASGPRGVGCAPEGRRAEASAGREAVRTPHPPGSGWPPRLREARLTWSGSGPAAANADAVQRRSTSGNHGGETLQQDAAASAAIHFRSGGLGSTPGASPLAAAPRTPVVYRCRRKKVDG